MAATHRTVAGTGVMLALVLAFASTAHAAFPGQNGKLAFQECPYHCGITTSDQSGWRARPSAGSSGRSGRR